MKSSIFTRFIAIILLLLGVGNSAWADTYTYTFSNYKWNATPANWTSGQNGASSMEYVQVTAASSGANGTSPISFVNVGKVVVAYHTNSSSGAGSIAVQVGSGTSKSQTVTKTGGTSSRTLEYNFSPNETGKVKLTVTCSTNSIYIESVTITYFPTKYTVTLKDEDLETLETLTQSTSGASVTLPSRGSVGFWSLAGWSTTDVGTTETTTAPAIISAGSYTPTDNVTLYPVYSRSVLDGGVVERKAQTMEYDTWSYSGSTTNKSGYRLFHTGSYISSSAFDLSTLSKVIVYGGTYGGDSYNSLTIGDGTNTWKNVTVSGNSQTGINTYTGGTALTGNKSLRITSNSGSASSNGVRISKVEIYVTEPSYTTYYIRKPTTGLLAPCDLTVTSPLGVTVGGTTAITYTSSSSGSMTFTSNDTSIATVDASGIVTGVAEGTTTITVSQAADATYAASTVQTVTVNVSAAAADGDYVKVTSAPSDWTGTYLIVYEEGGLAMNGGLSTLDVSGNSIGVTIVGNKIAASVANDNASFNIETDGEEGWAILSRSALYIGESASSNALQTSSSIISNTISLDASNNAVIAGESKVLRYNKAAGDYGTRFRYYTSGQQPIALYKRVNDLKAATMISFEKDDKTLVLGQHWTNPLTTNNADGTKTFISSDATKVSVDEHTGELTANALGGPVTITLSIAETATHTASSATYTVSVVPSNARYYRPVTSTIEIDAGIAKGKRFIIAALNKDGDAYHAMGEINSKKYAVPVEVTTEDREVMYLKLDADVQGDVNEFTLTKSSGAYTFRQSIDNTYLSHTTTNLDVHDIESSATITGNSEKFSLTYTNGAWVVENQGTPTWSLQYNENSPRFCCYVGSQVYPMIFMEGLAVASIGDDFAPDAVWTDENGRLTVSVEPANGATSSDYTVEWSASNGNIIITDDETGEFTGSTAGQLEVTILITPTGSTMSPVAKTFPMEVVGTVTPRRLSLFHETFGNNSSSARDWDDNYSVKSGVDAVYAAITGYTISNAKQSKNTMGSSESGLVQSTKATDAYIIIGPLNVKDYTNLKVTYQWAAKSVKGTYNTSLSYASSLSGDYISVSGTGVGAVGFIERSYDLPVAAQVESLYLKVVFNTSNTEAIIDEIDLTGIADTYSFKVYEGSSKYKMAFVQKVNPTLSLTDNAVAVIDGLTSAQKTAMPDAIKQMTNVVVNGTAYHLKVQDKVDGVYSPFYAPELLTSASKVSYARTAKEWNSLCLPFSLPFGKVTDLFGDGAEIYQLTAVDANCQVVFTKFESGTIAAGTPVLVKSIATSWNAEELAGPFDIKGDEPVIFTPVGSCSTSGTAELLGSYKEIVPGTVDGSQLYKLMTTASGQCFGKLSATGKVYPFRIYLKYTPPTAQSAPANLPVKIHVIEGTIGDLNKDKMATLSDLTMMINMVNGAEEKTNAADLDGDGDVNGVDVNRLAKILVKSK